MSVTEDRAQVVKNTAIISVLNGLGLISALALDVVLAARLGLGKEMDALFVALTLPQLNFAILFVSCRAVLVPAFARTRTEQGEARAWQLYRMTITAALLIFGALAVIGVAAAPVLVSLMAPGLTTSGRLLVVRLLRIVFWLVLPSGAIQTMGAMLNVYRRFAAPAALNLVQYSIVLVAALLGMDRWGIAAVATGYVAASFAQLVLLGRSVSSIGGRYWPMLDLGDVELRRVARLMVPSLLQGAAGQGSILAERVVGSFLPAGSIAALAYARRVLRAVSDLFLDSVATALLPRLSALSAEMDVPGLKRMMNFGARLTLLISVPAVVWLAVLNIPIVRLAFQRGAFDASATALTAGIMAIYVLGVPPMAVLQVVTDAFFALRDTLTPLYVRLFTLAINLGLDVVLVALFGAHGLALALLIARCMGLVAGMVLLRRRIGPLGLDTAGFGIKLALATGALAATSYCSYMLLGRQLTRGLLQHTLALGGAMVLGCGAFLVAAVLLRMDETSALWNAAHRRLLRRRIVRSA